MKLTFFRLAICAGVLFAAAALQAGLSPAPYAKVLFEDDFSGDELKADWGSWKSETIVRDGVMVGITPEKSDHPSVNQIKLPPLTDMEVALKFKFNGSPRFSIMFRDLDYKGAHAGHICHVGVGKDSISLYDGKLGIFCNEVYDKKKAGIKLDEATKEDQKKRLVRNKIDLDPEQWHTLRIRIEGDVMKAWIDGALAGELKSEGIAHPTKSNMNITSNDREMLYDDFSIRVPE